MKLFINARFLTQPVSGVQRYGIECCRQIKAIYPQAVFLTPGAILHKNVAKELGAVSVGKLSGHRWEQFELPKYLAGHKNAPLINLANTAPLFYKNNFSVIHDLAFFHHPEWNSRAFSLWYNFMVPRLARRSRHIFTVSNTIKDELIKYYGIPSQKISITYNGIAADMMALAGRPINKEKLILTVGTFNIRKNQHTLIKAFLQSSLKDSYKLVLVGDRNRVFRDSGIGEDVAGGSIEVHDKLNDTQLVDLYQRAEILVSLSNYEGFGIPVLEGLFWRCKVLCSDIPVYRELFEPHVSYCDQKSVDDVAASLAKLSDGGRTPSADDLAILLAKYNYRSAAEVIIDQVLRNSKL